MAKNLSIDDLLESLTHEGEQDSSGAFTLDIAKATEKIRAFQLADPFHYCLRWLQAAVSGGGSFFGWESNPSGVKLRILGFQLEAQVIPRLPGLLFDSAASPAQRHLSAGLNAVIRTKARAVHITSGGARGSWRPGGYQHQLLGKPVQGIKIELERTRGDTLGELWYAANHHFVGAKPGTANYRDREQRLLHARGACAPLQIEVQGFSPEWQPLYQPPKGALDHLLSLVLYPILPSHPFKVEKWLLHNQADQGFLPPQKCWAENTRKSPPTRCRIYYAHPKAPHQHSFLYAIRDGVMLPVQEILKGQSGSVFLADVNHLNTDLSGLQLIQDEAYRSLLEELRGLLAKSS